MSHSPNSRGDPPHDKALNRAVNSSVQLTCSILFRLEHHLAIASLGCLTALGCAHATQRIQLTERSHLTAPEEFAVRRGIHLLPIERDGLAYELTAESFEVYVPMSIEPGEPRGGLVWVSPGKSGAPPRTWASVLDRHGVVWIGANDSGNRGSPPDRVNLALDAAAHLLRLLEARRAPVFIGGFSGGARIASEVALLYPDVFSGGMFVGAADYFRFVQSSDPRWSAWEPTFPSPPGNLLDLARSRGRYVLLAGSRDFNRTLVRDVHRAYLADGFSAAKLLEVPDLGHELPPPRCFESALVELLSGMSEESRRLASRCTGPTADGVSRAFPIAPGNRGRDLRRSVQPNAILGLQLLSVEERLEQ